MIWGHNGLMEIQWQNGALVVQPRGEGERRVLESVVDCLCSLNRVDIHHCPPSSPDRIEFIDNQPVGSLVDKSLQVIA
jgi:hypothetical protein